MPREQPYLQNFIPHFYKRKQIDVMIFIFIDTYRLAQPSVTLMEAAAAFLKRYGISRELYDEKCVLMTYDRTLNDYRAIDPEYFKANARKA